MANDTEKTSRIGYLCLTLIVLGLLFFLSKANACGLAFKSCNNESVCKDEFFEIKNDGYASNHSCTPGAHVEVVASPPAPKPGIMCHCLNSDGDAAAPSVAPK